MPHPLAVRIAALRRRARAVFAVHGIAWTTALALGVISLLCLGDYLWRYDELGIRLLSTFAALGILGWAAYRFLLPAFNTKFDDVFLAQQIERRHPELRERLSSAVAFLRSPANDAYAGSASLRRTVIEETTHDAVTVDVRRIASWRPAIMPSILAAIVVGLSLAAYWADPGSAQTAMRRLALPFGSTTWPQMIRLRFVNPVTRMAAGSRFRAEVVYTGPAEILDEVTLLVRTSPDAAPERRTMHLQGGSYVAEREAVTNDFSYRAVGGDDRSMEWIDVRVIDPPTATEMRWTYRYPEYAQWQTFDSGAKPFDGLAGLSAIPVGTVVEFHGRATKPLAEIRWIAGPTMTLLGKLDADRLGFSFTTELGNSWTAARSESFRFEFVGDDGFVGGGERRFDQPVEADPPPWAKLESPRGPPEDPRGDVYVTPEAEVEIAVEAGDAFTVRPVLALKEIALRYSRSDLSAEPDATVVLHAGPAVLEPAEQPAPTTFRDEETRRVATTWNLKPLAVKPGTILNAYAAATDYAGQTRQSESKRLRVVGRTEFLDRLNERQRALHAELDKLRTRQNEAIEFGSELARKIQNEPQANDKQADASARLLEAQRQIGTSLGLDRPNASTPPKEGVRGRIERMLADLAANKIDNREISGRLQNIDAQLQQLADSKATERAAAAVAESLREDLADDAGRRTAAEALQRAKGEQETIAKSLEAMLRNLAQWENYGKFHEELSRIAGEQQKLADDTREHLQDKLSKKGDPTAEARKRDDLSGKQSALARRFETLRRNMTQAAGEPGTEDRAALEQAVAAAEKADPAAAMRAAGDDLRNDRVGQVPGRQQEALDKLRNVMQALSAQNADELARLVAKLKEKEQELAGLRAAQQGLKKKLREAEKNPNEAERKRELERLAREQHELQKQTEKLAEQLKRLKAERSAARTAKGGEKMAASGEGAQQGNAQDAAEQAEAAERDLEEAARELARERRQAEADLARELAAKLEDDLKASIARQERIVAETQRYDGLAKEKPLTRAEQVGLLDLAREQETLEAEARAAAEKFGAAPAFKAAIEGAADEMHRAAQNLRERNTGEATQRAEQTAVRRYQQLISALKPRSGKPEGGKPSGGDAVGAGGGEGGGDRDADALAQLTLIKLMQEDVSARTKELDQLRRRGPLAPTEQEEFQRLGREQGKLADLLLDLIGDEPTQPAADPLELKLDEPNEKK